MKKQWIFLIILLVVVAAVVCFTLLWDSIAAPGDLPDPKTIPKADTTGVGTTVTLSLEQQLKGQSNQYVTYAYISDPGRLMVFTGDVTDSTIMRMTVYELPEARLLDILSGEVEAKILGVANVSLYEWQLLNTCIYAARQEASASDSEVIDLTKSDLPTGDGTRFYFGYYAAMNSGGLEQEVAPGRFAFLFGNIAQNQSNNMANAIQNLKNTAKRFSLMEVLGI